MASTADSRSGGVVNGDAGDDHTEGCDADADVGVEILNWPRSSRNDFLATTGFCLPKRSKLDSSTHSPSPSDSCSSCDSCIASMHIWHVIISSAAGSVASYRRLGSGICRREAAAALVRRDVRRGSGPASCNSKESMPSAGMSSSQASSSTLAAPDAGFTLGFPAIFARHSAMRWPVF